MSEKRIMACGCEHGMKCTKVSVCRMDDEVRQARQDVINEIRDWQEIGSLSDEQFKAIEALVTKLEAA